MSDIIKRLESDKVVILDGGVGTEIQRRGVAMNEHAWCGVANRENPDVVRQVHVDYIHAGAEVITANTFGTARHVLEPAGYGDEVEAINRSAVKHAQEAREEAADGQVWIAGSLSSMPALSRMHRTPTGSQVADNYREQADILAGAGMDLIICAMMLDRDNVPLVIEAAKTTGLPVWVGFSAQKHPDHDDIVAWREQEFWDLPIEPFNDLVRDMVSVGGDVIGVMHSYVGATDRALAQLKQYWNGPTLAYAETGHFERPTYVFREDMDPDTYSEVALRWRDVGVKVIGGCCGTGPEHISAIAKAMNV